MVIRFIKNECCSGSMEIRRNPVLINVILDTKEDCGSVTPERGYVMLLVRSCWKILKRSLKDF